MSDCTEKNVLQWSITRSNQEVLAQNLGIFTPLCTVRYVREHTEFEGLLPWLVARSNLKFCMFSVTETLEGSVFDRLLGNLSGNLSASLFQDTSCTAFTQGVRVKWYRHLHTSVLPWCCIGSWRLEQNLKKKDFTKPSNLIKVFWSIFSTPAKAIEIKKECKADEMKEKKNFWWNENEVVCRDVTDPKEGDGLKIWKSRLKTNVPVFCVTFRDKRHQAGFVDFSFWSFLLSRSYVIRFEAADVGVGVLSEIFLFHWLSVTSDEEVFVRNTSFGIHSFWKDSPNGFSRTQVEA